MKKISRVFLLLCSIVLVATLVGCGGGDIVEDSVAPMPTLKAPGLSWNLHEEGGVYKINPGYLVQFYAGGNDYDKYKNDLKYYYTVGVNGEMPEDPTEESLDGSRPNGYEMTRQDVTLKVRSYCPGKANPSPVSVFKLVYDKDFRYRPSLHTEKGLSADSYLENGTAGTYGETLNLYVKNNEDIAAFPGSIWYSTDENAKYEFDDKGVLQKTGTWTKLENLESPIAIEGPAEISLEDVSKFIHVVFVGDDGKISSTLNRTVTWYGNAPNTVFITQAGLTPSYGKYIVLTNTSTEKDVNLAAYSLALSNGEKIGLKGMLEAGQQILLYHKHADNKPDYVDWYESVESKLNVDFEHLTGDKSLSLMKNGEEKDGIPANTFSTSKSKKNKQVALRVFSETPDSNLKWKVTDIFGLPSSAYFKVIPYVASDEVEFYVNGNLVVPGEVVFPTASEKKIAWYSANEVKNEGKAVTSNTVVAKDDVKLTVGTKDYAFSFKVVRPIITYKVMAADPVFDMDDVMSVVNDNKANLIGLVKNGSYKVDNKDVKDVAISPSKVFTGIVASISDDGKDIVVQSDVGSVFIRYWDGLDALPGDVVTFKAKKISQFNGKLQFDCDFVENKGCKERVVYYKDLSALTSEIADETMIDELAFYSGDCNFVSVDGKSVTIKCGESEYIAYCSDYNYAQSFAELEAGAALKLNAALVYNRSKENVTTKQFAVMNDTQLYVVK